MSKNEILYVGSSFEMTEFIGDDLLIGVPFDAPQEFKKRIWAAARSYQFGNKSTDYFLRTYGKYWKFERASTSRRRMADFLRLCIIEAESAHGEIMNGNSREDCCAGLMAAEITLGRHVVTFRSAVFSLVQGYALRGCGFDEVGPRATRLGICSQGASWSGVF